MNIFNRIDLYEDIFDQIGVWSNRVRHFLIAVCENNAENAQQKADGWPGRWNFFEPEFLGIGGETQFGGFWDFWSGGVSSV